MAFHFYYPPYSILRQLVWKDTNITRFDNQLMMKGWIFEQLAPYQNVRVYDFQTKIDWTYNLALYTDLSHHNQDVNTWIAQAIGREDEEYLLTENSAQAFTDQLVHQVHSVLITDDRKLMNVEVVLRNDQSQRLIFSSRIMPSATELLVPAKELATVLGASMNWDQAAKHITLEHNGNLIEMTIGSSEMIVNGTALTLLNPAVIRNNITFIPLHVITEGLGYKIKQESVNEYSTVFTIDEGIGR